MKLARLYYTCLYQLFKFKFSEENSNSVYINTFLSKYNIFSFEYRFLYKLLNFSFLIKNAQDSPIELKDQLSKPYTQPIHEYNLRQRPDKVLDVV